MNMGLAWENSLAGRSLRSLGRWAEGSALLAALLSLSRTVGRWCESSRIRRVLGSVLGGEAVRSSVLLSPLRAVPDWWWRWSEPARATILRAAGDSTASTAVRWLARPEPGPLQGSIVGRAARSLCSHSYVLIALLAVAVFWPFVPTTAIGLFIGALWVLRFIAGPGSRPGGPAFRPIPVATPWLLLAAVIPISWALSVTRSGSLPGLVAWVLAFMAAYLTLDSLWTHRQFIGLFGAVTASGVAASLVGLGQAVMRIQTVPGWVDSKYFPEITTRIYSVFDSPIILGQFLAVSMPLGLYLALTTRGRERLWYLAATGIQGLALVLTWTRGSWLAALVSCLLLVFWYRRTALAVFLCAMLLAPVVLPDVVLSRFATSFDLEYGTNRYRRVIWATSVEMIRDHPLTGIGLGTETFGIMYPYYMIAGTPAAHSHNLLLQLALELGVPGMLAVVWLLLAVAGLALRRLRSSPAGANGPTAALGAALAGIMVQGMADHIWYSPKFMLFFWLLLGATLASLVLASGEDEIR